MHQVVSSHFLSQALLSRLAVLPTIFGILFMSFLRITRHHKATIATKTTQANAPILPTPASNLPATFGVAEGAVDEVAVPVSLAAAAAKIVAVLVSVLVATTVEPPLLVLVVVTTSVDVVLPVRVPVNV